MNDSLGNRKRVLRTEMRQLRDALGNRQERSQRIWEFLDPVLRKLQRTTERTRLVNPTSMEPCAASVSVDSAFRVFVFRGVGAEPGTDAWIAHMRSKGITVCLPRCEGKVMVAVDIGDDTEYHAGPFGILEPVGPAIDPTVIDAVIVPGLAFTAQGQRLGQGGGFYDQFLPLLRNDCATIGVCFDAQLLQSVPSEHHDQLMQLVITDEGRQGLSDWI